MEPGIHVRGLYLLTQYPSLHPAFGVPHYPTSHAFNPQEHTRSNPRRDPPVGGGILCCRPVHSISFPVKA